MEYFNGHVELGVVTSAKVKEVLKQPFVTVGVIKLGVAGQLIVVGLGNADNIGAHGTQ